MDKIRPPKMTPVPSSVIMDQGIRATLLQTYERILALACRHDYKFTDWLTLDELQSILGVDRATILRHVGPLKACKLLDWTTDGKNRYRFSILEVRLEQVAKSPLCDPSSSSGSNTDLSQAEPPLPLAKSQNCDLSASTDACTCAGTGVLDREAWQALRDARIGEPARTELANLPMVTAWYIRAMAASVARDFNQGLISSVVPVLIYRLRNDWPAPEWCSECGGLDGEHADSCPTQAERRAREAAERKATIRMRESGSPARAPMSAEMQAAMGVWQQALSVLRLQLTGATFDTWLSRTACVGRENETFVIGAHNGYAKDWLENRLMGMVKRTLSSIVGQNVEVQFVVWNKEFEADKEGAHEA